MQLRKLRELRTEWVPRFDQRSRLFDGLQPMARRFADREGWPDVASLTDLVRACAAPHEAPRFVLQGPKRRGPRDRSSLYDARIVEHDEVPTRERHWHDTMNALAWAAFPRCKRALHARQLAVLTAQLEPTFAALPTARTPEHDALAMLDEGGVVILAERELCATIAAELRVPVRDALTRALCEGRARLWALGHGMLESVLLADGALPETHAFACVLEAETLPPGPAEARSMADLRLAEALETRMIPAVERPWPCVTITEAWLASLPDQRA